MSKISLILLQLVILIAITCFVGCQNGADSNKEKSLDNQNSRQPASDNEDKNEKGNTDSQPPLPQADPSDESSAELSSDLETFDISELQTLMMRPESDTSIIFADMVKTYYDATSYGDFGFVEFKYKLPDGTQTTEIRNCTFAYQKPNKVRMEVNRGQLVSDGTLFTAQVADNSVLFGQLIEKRAPEQIGIKDIYNDYLLANLMDLGVPPEVLFVPPQIVLLFAQDPLQTLIPEGAEIRMGFPEYILSGDKQTAYACDKINVTDKLTGRRTYWIDRDTNILMRMEFDVSRIPDTEVMPVSIKIELRDAVIDPELSAAAFMMETPRTSLKVTELTPPHLMMLGKVPDGTICTDEKNQQIALAAPTQKGVTVAVLFVTDPQAADICQLALQSLQRLSALYEGNTNVNCFPVAIDAETVTNTAIANTLKSWGINLPYLRQPEREIMTRLGLTDVPTFLVFGPNGALQLIESELPTSEDLSQFVNMVLAGQEPYQLIFDHFQGQKTAYHQSIDAFISYDIFRTEPEHVQIAERTESQTMTLTEAWRRTEFVSPGNPHVVGPAMLIPHDFQKISVLNSEGQIMELADGNSATITPQGIAADMPLHYIRNAVGPEGQRYFAVMGINQKQLFVFDKDLNPVLTWPLPADAGKYEIAAVQLADLTGNGTPEIVIGYRVPAENSQHLAAIDLAGKTVWDDRSVTEPDQIAIVLKNKVPHIWIVNRYNDTNALVEFDAAGKKLREWQVDSVGGLIWKLFAADLDGDGNSEVLAVLPRAGEIVVAGVNSDGRVGKDASQKPLLWEHAISPGSHGVKSFEFVVSGDINGDSFGEWCVAAADGTIYFIDRTGKPLDSFASGELLSGMAVVPGDGVVMLVLTTSKDRYDTNTAEDAVIALKTTHNTMSQNVTITPDEILPPEEIIPPGGIITPVPTPAMPDVPVASELQDILNVPEFTLKNTDSLTESEERIPIPTDETSETEDIVETDDAFDAVDTPEPTASPILPSLPPLPPVWPD